VLAVADGGRRKRPPVGHIDSYSNLSSSTGGRVREMCWGKMLPSDDPP